MEELEFNLSASIYVSLFISLVVLPLGYWGLCRWMASVTNAPTLEFFFIFGSLGGYLLLSVGVALVGRIGLLTVIPFLLCAYGALIFSMVSSLRAFPRSGFHLAAAITSGLLMLAPVALVICF